MKRLAAGGFRRLMIAAHLAGVVATAFPVAYGILELQRLDDAIADVNALHSQSALVHDIVELTAAGALATSVAVLELDRHEQERVLHQTDAQFDGLMLKMESLWIEPPAHVDRALLVELQVSVGRVLHTWAEIRSGPDSLSGAEKAFHFLHMTTAARRVSDLLSEVQDRYAAAIGDAERAIRSRIAAAIAALLAVMLLSVAISAMASTANFRLWRRSERARQRLAAKEHALRVEHDRFAAALAHMPHGLVMLDRDLNLLVCNDQFAAIYDLPPHLRRPGTPLDRITEHRRSTIAAIEGGEVATLVEDVHRSYVAGERFRRIAELKNGRIIQVTRERTAAGPWIALHEDITEIRIAETERAHALAEAETLRLQERAAEAASQAKSTLLATMSHEIRTPMNALVGLSSTLLESELDADQRRAVEAIHDSSDNLLRLLNDILDHAKLESGRIELEAQPFSPRMLVDNAVSIMRHRAEAKGLLLRVDVDADVPPALTGDAGRLRQVLLNLLSNAVKFTDVGEIVIGLRTLAREAGGARLAFAVSDRGIGIAPERIGSLFTDFVQADSSITRRFGGTGLGLAISRRIVAQMGGSIGVTSQLGRGSTFTFDVTLPLADEAELAPRGARGSAAALSAAIAGLGRPLRVLLAEDNRTNQLVVRQMLKEFAIALTVVEDGADAVVAAAAGDFDLIFMDVRMAEMDGLTATAAIRGLSPCRSVPIIALTANAFAQDIRDCHAAGMTDFLAKPVRKPALVDAVLRALRARPLATVADAPPLAPDTPPPPPAPAAADPVFDPAVYARLAAEIGEDGAAETAATFLDDTRTRLATLRALAGSERRRIQTEAHTLKGAAGTFGLVALARLARDLEAAAPTIAADDYRAAVAAIAAAFEAAAAALPAASPAG